MTIANKILPRRHFYSVSRTERWTLKSLCFYFILFFSCFFCLTILQFFFFFSASVWDWSASWSERLSVTFTSRLLGFFFLLLHSTYFYCSTRCGTAVNCCDVRPPPSACGSHAHCVLSSPNKVIAVVWLRHLVCLLFTLRLFDTWWPLTLWPRPTRLVIPTHPFTPAVPGPFLLYCSPVLLWTYHCEAHTPYVDTFTAKKNFNL